MKGMSSMYNYYPPYPCPNLANLPYYTMSQSPYWYSSPGYQPPSPHCPQQPIALKDYGPQPFVVNIEQATRQNQNFRLALWTGCHLQLTLMSINPGDDIGLEMHPQVDQFIRIQEGQGAVKMGDCKERLDFQREVFADYAIFIPAGTWHNVINTGRTPLKLYSIYAPPEHPHGTVQKTKQDADKPCYCYD